LILEHKEEAGRVARNAIEDIVRQLGLTMRQEVLDVWENGAFFLTIVLEESHITLTSYPEHLEGYSIKIHVELCNFENNNYDIAIDLADRIAKALGPILIKDREIVKEGPKLEDVEEVLRLLDAS
jgi:S-adenosylmethionine/arginine decarboxylase-like enzyme